MLANRTSAIIRLNGVSPNHAASILLPEETARKFSFVPLWLQGNDLLVACTEPADLQTVREVESACRRRVIPFKANASEIRATLDKIYGLEANQAGRFDYGEILFTLGYLSEDDLGKVRAHQAGSQKSIMTVCREDELVDDEKLAEVAGVFCELPYLRLKGMRITSDLSALIPWELATLRKAIPLFWLAGILVVACPELSPGDNLDDIAAQTELPIQPVVCSRTEWQRLYRQLYLRGNQDPHSKDLEIIQWLANHNELPGLDLRAVQALALQTDVSLETIMISRNICSRVQWNRAQAELYKIQLISEWKDYRKLQGLQEDLSYLLPESIARKFKVLPLKLENNRLIIAVSNPDEAISRLVEGMTGVPVHAYLLGTEDLEDRLNVLYEYAPRRQPLVVPDLGELLQKTREITNHQLEEALSAGKETRMGVGESLISAGYLDEIGFVEALGLQTGLPFIHLAHLRPQTAIIAQIPADFAVQHALIPIWSTEKEIWIALTDPFDTQTLTRVEELTGKHVKAVLAPRSAILATLERLPGNKQRSSSNPRVMDVLQKMVEAGFLTQIGATQALGSFERDHLSLDKAIANASHRPLDETAGAVAKIIGLPFVSLQLQEEKVTRVDPLGQFVERSISHDPVDEKAAHLLGLADAQALSVLPISFNGEALVAAFADPNYDEDLEKLQRILAHKIEPVFAFRDDLESAIQRVLGKRNIGNYLLMDGLLNQGQLNNALDFARNTGVRLGKALVNRGFITESQLYQYLSKQTALPYYDLSEMEIDPGLAQSIPASTARKYGILPFTDRGGQLLLATVDPFNTEGLQTARELLKKEFVQVLVTENDLENALEKLFSPVYLDQSISELLDRTPRDSAYKVLSTWQAIGLALFALLSIIWIIFDFTSYIIVLNALSTVFYITFSSYKFYLVYRALSNNMEVEVNEAELQALDDRNLPIYTILVPVYKEAEVLPELLGALKKLEYPTTKLDIQVLMEADDQETIAAFTNWNPPSHFRGIVVPFGNPKTKPKACNYGLIHARGDYVVIFDAEDVPQPDQLKKILVAFSKSSPQVACIQSKLNYYNSDQNLLTRWFTVEYSMWFDLFLPGLSATNAPIPLGGTSNHFKKDALVEIGAWDPYNVTEDADLGVRLFKRGYKTAIVESTTFEEANSQIGNWIRQRSRWIKGYIQTWLVHMRNPVRLIREIGMLGFLSFQFVVGGTFFAALINPIYWLLTTLWFIYEWKFIQIIFPGMVFFLGAVCLFLGNFAFTYMNVAGALRRGQYSMVKVALISPIYWALASVAAWVGFVQLLYKPHFWEKTTHGLHPESRMENSTPGK